jgi:FAD/FMN-containing dehydrogenase
MFYVLHLSRWLTKISQCNHLTSALPGGVSRGPPVNLWSKFQTEVTPKCTVEPTNAVEVAEVLTVAKTYQCHFAVLAGGTSPFRYASNADGGITINMKRMRRVVLDEDPLQVKVGAGALWEDVYRELDPRNMSAAGTRNGRNGVTGSILGGTSPNNV